MSQVWVCLALLLLSFEGGLAARPRQEDAAVEVDVDTSPSSPVSTLEVNEEFGQQEKESTSAEDVAVDTDASASAWTLKELEQQAKDLASTEELEQQAKDSTLIQEDMAVDTDASTSASTEEELEQQVEATTSIQEDMAADTDASTSASNEELEQQAEATTSIQDNMAVDTDASTSASTEELEQQAEATTSIQENMAVDTDASTLASTEELEQQAEATTSIQENMAVDTDASTSASTEELEQQAEATTSIQENMAVDTDASTSASTEELEQQAEATTSIQENMAVDTDASTSASTEELEQQAEATTSIQAQGVPEPQLAHLAAEAGAKLESELQADFDRAHEASGKYRAAQTEIAKELKALSNGTQNLQAQIPAEHAPLLTKIEKVLQPTVIAAQPADQGQTDEEEPTPPAKLQAKPQAQGQTDEEEPTPPVQPQAQPQAQDFDDDCPPLELAGYRLVLRGSWSGNIEVAIQISVKHCAHLCTADPACLGFSLHVQNRHGSDGRGLCSHYEKAGDPKPSDSCTYAFSKAEQPNAEDDASAEGGASTVTHSEAKPQVQGQTDEEKPTPVAQHSTVHSKDPKKVASVRGSRGGDASGGSAVRPRSGKQDRRMDTIPEPVLGSDQVQDAHVADRQAAAFNAVPDAQLLPDPPESDGYKGKKPGPEVLFLEDPRKWPMSMKARDPPAASRSSLVQVPAVHVHRHLVTPEWKP